jgi:hypothetical protein
MDLQTWLDGIKEKSVKEEARDSLELYRTEFVTAVRAATEVNYTESEIVEETLPVETAPAVRHVVSFYGDEIMCVQNSDGEPYASVKSLCKNVSIFSPKDQYKKIRDDGVLRWEDIPLPSSGGTQNTFCIHIGDVPLWLGGVSVQSVNEAVRPSLRLYKRECGQALEDYFYKGRALNPRFTQNQDLTKINTELKQIQNKINQLSQKVDELSYRNDLKLEDLESQLRTGHGKRLVEIHEKLIHHVGPAHFATVLAELKKCMAEELNPYAYFKMYDLFMDAYPELTKDKAQKLATDFRKLPEVEKYQRGTKRTSYVAKRYERKDYDVLRDMAIAWYRKTHPDINQKTLFED